MKKPCSRAPKGENKAVYPFKKIEGLPGGPL